MNNIRLLIVINYGVFSKIVNKNNKISLKQINSFILKLITINKLKIIFQKLLVIKNKNIYKINKLNLKLKLII